MRHLNLLASVVTAIAVVGCAMSADEEPIEGLNEPTVTGLNLVGTVTEIVTNANGRSYPNIQFNVRITVENVTASATDVTYRTSCPVRMELYKQDGTKVYDESVRECAAGLSTISVAAGAREFLFSGVRFPTTVLGDSLSPGRYRVVAVLQKDDAPLRVEAGNYNIPLCTELLGCRAVAAARGAER